MGWVTDTYKISSEYGMVEKIRNGVPHTGIDLAMEVGTKLRSVMDGRVKTVFSGMDEIGKGVIILGRDGREYIYGHMDSVDVVVGESVKVGRFLGESGNTGHSTGPHLHFAVRENGEYIDPTPIKAMLDSITGEISSDNIPWYNGRNELINDKPTEEVPWWDLQAQANLAIETKAEAMKQEFTDSIVAFLQAIVDVTVDLSHAVALLGGGLLIVFRAVGMRRATRYFGVLQTINIIIVSLFQGGVTWETETGYR